jgi:hypothetical protein
MTKIKMIEASLLGSSSALGLNWIYDKELLIKYSKDNEVLFTPIDHDLYNRAKNGFDVYPNSVVGDLDFMGEMLHLFHDFLENNVDISPKNWRKVVYNYIKPEGPYNAYIEKYGKVLISKYEDEIYNDKKPQINTDHVDKQLIGLALFTEIYENDKFINKVEESLKYARILTSYSGIDNFTELLFNLFNDLSNGVEKEQALLNNIKYAPKEYQEQLQHSLHKVDTHFFIGKFSGVACELNQSFPLIYHIVAHNDTWEDALTQNAILGGASSARGILISAIFNIIDIIPIEYRDKLRRKI